MFVSSQLATARAEIHNQPAPQPTRLFFFFLFFSRPLSTDLTKRDPEFQEISSTLRLDFILISSALLGGSVPCSLLSGTFPLCTWSRVFFSSSSSSQFSAPLRSPFPLSGWTRALHAGTCSPCSSLLGAGSARVWGFEYYNSQTSGPSISPSLPPERSLRATARLVLTKPPPTTTTAATTTTTTTDFRNRKSSSLVKCYRRGANPSLAMHPQLP